jgi:hypothetical protein
MRLKGYDAWKTRADLDDWAAQNHEPPAGCCSLCGTRFGDNDAPWAYWSSDGGSANLCDACVSKPVEVEKEA